MPSAIPASPWLSNLPLANMQHLKDGSQAVVSRIKSPDSEVQVNDQDDEGLWYDTSSQASLSPVTSTSADIENSHASPQDITPEEKERLLPYMPSLFGTDLPPCNADIQIAYENVVNRLRTQWLNQRGQAGTVDLCHAVKTELSNQNFMFPAFSIKGRFKKRKPWRRENVFKYELRWIEYFLKEAQGQSPELMTESESMERKKEASTPDALGFNINRPDVSKLWDQWNLKKRAKTLAVPEEISDSGLASGSTDKRTPKETNGTRHNLSDNTESDVALLQSTTKGDSDDAHLWSQGGHD